MCKTMSCILKNDYTVLSVPGSDSHEDIVEEYQLRDNYIGKKREWLRVELLPLKTLHSTNKEDWKFSLNMDLPYPDWYDYEMAVDCCLNHLFKEIKKGRYKGEGLELTLASHIKTVR